MLIRTPEPQNAEALFAKADQYPLGTNPWFENVLMAIWAEPKRKYVEEFKKGCAIFKSRKSFGINNYRTDPGLAETATGAWIAENIRYLSLKFGGEDKPRQYIDIRTGRYVGPDVGFLRHNYYFLRAFLKSMRARRTPAGKVSDYSEIAYLSNLD